MTAYPVASFVELISSLGEWLYDTYKGISKSVNFSHKLKVKTDADDYIAFAIKRD